MSTVFLAVFNCIFHFFNAFLSHHLLYFSHFQPLLFTGEIYASGSDADSSHLSVATPLIGKLTTKITSKFFCGVIIIFSFECQSRFRTQHGAFDATNVVYLLCSVFQTMFLLSFSRILDVAFREVSSFSFSSREKMLSRTCFFLLFSSLADSIPLQLARVSNSCQVPPATSSSSPSS